MKYLISNGKDFWGSKGWGSPEQALRYEQAGVDAWQSYYGGLNGNDVWVGEDSEAVVNWKSEDDEFFIPDSMYMEDEEAIQEGLEQSLNGEGRPLDEFTEEFEDLVEQKETVG